MKLAISNSRLRWALALLLIAGCGGAKPDPQAEAPPQGRVEREPDANLVEVEHPEQFPLVSASAHEAFSQLSVTGSVVPDISRSVPVISLASGRVIELDARLGDSVKKGQLLLKVQSADLAAAFSDYRKAVADQQLVLAQRDRAKLLYDKGAISLNDLQIAQDAEEKAQIDVENTRERLRVLGASPEHPAAIVEIRAPVSGVITDQQVTNSSGVAGLGSPNPFTISDLSTVWILCDVYENELAGIELNETAQIQLNAYPGRTFAGRISNIGPVLDPNLRTAKVRIEVRNPGLMRIGMFVTATLKGQKKESRAAVPAGAILHLHDRDWIYIPEGERKFRRLEVRAGVALPNNMQEIAEGLKAGQKLVSNALVLQNTVEQ